MYRIEAGSTRLQVRKLITESPVVNADCQTTRPRQARAPQPEDKIGNAADGARHKALTNVLSNFLIDSDQFHVAQNARLRPDPEPTIYRNHGIAREIKPDRIVSLQSIQAC